MRNYPNYSTSQTIRYKSGYIHTTYFGNTEVVKVSLNNWAYATETKSIHAAKVAITRYIKKCLTSKPPPSNIS